MVEAMLLVMMAVAVAALVISIIDMKKEATTFEELEETEENLLAVLAIVTARQYEFERRLNKLEEKENAADR